MAEPRNIIALLTDFGTKDYFVGAMKGVILSINKDARIVDITHEIAAQNIPAASFVLRACYENFPRGTIFVAVVDPGVGSDRKAILVETENYFFVAPDNNLLAFVFDSASKFNVFELSDERFFNHPVSRTFHGRDIFAPVAAHLSGGVKPENFGAQTGDYIFNREIAPRENDDGEIVARIIHADHFGNLVTNLKQTDLPENFAVEIGGRRVENRREFFAAAEIGELLLIFGSAGFLEIVAFHDSARKILNAKVGQDIKVLSAK